MRAFFGGMIEKEHRGDNAVVIRKKEKIVDKESYGVFIYPIFSEEFIQLTGVMQIRNPVERAYIGVSLPAGEVIAKKVDGRLIDYINLRTIDDLIIRPHFLDKNLEKPERIVLRSIAGSIGYEIIPEEKK